MQHENMQLWKVQCDKTHHNAGTVETKLDYKENLNFKIFTAIDRAETKEKRKKLCLTKQQDR